MIMIMIMTPSPGQQIITRLSSSVLWLSDDNVSSSQCPVVVGEPASHPSWREEKSAAVLAADTDGANITVIMRALQCCSAHYTRPRDITPGPGNLTHIALNSNKETFPKPRQLPPAPCSMPNAGAGRIKRYQMILSPSRRIMSIKATRETEQFFRGHKIL